MASIFNNVSIDESDKRFKQLKDKFIEEIKVRFTCEDYEPIINYVFNFVFESKNTKENSIKEMRELFHDKTEEIMGVLWDLTESTYNINSSSKDNDLLEEIYKEKNENQPKRFNSQIVNPNPEPSVIKPYQGSIHQQQNEGPRDDRRSWGNARGRDYYPRDNSNNYGYRRNDNYHQQNKDFDDRGKRSYEFRTMRIGDKQLVIKKQGLSRSRSRSNDRSNERVDKNEKEVEEVVYQDRGNMRDHAGPREMQPYDKYYNQPSYRGERGGFFAPRRFMRGGRYPRYMQQRYMEPRFMEPRMMEPRMMEPRRMFVKNSLGGRNMINKEKSEVETNTSLPPQGEKLENNVPSVETPVAEVNHEHRHHEGEKSDPAKKKQIRCKKWPQCKTVNCEFAHPTGTCPYFPKCVFNEKCLYIHPNIPCKFGYYCTRVGCSYSHPTGYNPGMYNNMMGGMQPPVAWGPPKFKNLTIDYNKKEATDKNKMVKQESVEPMMPTQEVNSEINQI